MTINSDEFREQIYQLQHEPARVTDYVVDLMEEALVAQNAFVMNPSQPLPFMIETAALLSSGAIDSYIRLTMQQYAVMSQTETDLYPHLSDADMIGIFATPGKCTFTFVLSKAEVLTTAVQIGDSDSRKLTIPRHTQVRVNGLTFTMQYPIDIVVKPYGGIEITLDMEQDSPLQPLATTRLNWEIKRQNPSVQGQQPNEYILIEVPINQMSLNSFVMKSNPTTILNKTYTFPDQFVHARAFRQTSQGTWVEIKTTHAEHTFDPNVPTLLLKVVDNTIKVTLPHVYQLTSLGSAQIRLDVYSCRGDIYMDLSGIAPGVFVTDFIDRSNADAGRYTAPLAVLDTFITLSNDAVSGGSSEPTFNVKRERVINNSVGPIVQPISPSQMQSAIEKLGFTVSLSVDDVIGRIWKVSRRMPSHVSGITTAPIDVAVLTARSSMEELVQRETIVDNGDTLTILPSTLYQDIDGELHIVSDEERVAIDNAVGDIKVNLLSDGRYLFTPLHYLISSKNRQFDVIPYYLTNPRLGLTGYSATNDTIDVYVQTANGAYITYTDQGYVINVMTESNTPYKDLDNSQVHVQLAFKPTLESEWVYANGTLVDVNSEGERRFTFNINTRWELLENHQLFVTNFTLRENSPQLHSVVLSGEWHIVWSVSDYSVPGMTSSVVDQQIGHHLLPPDVVGVHSESLPIHLGNELTGLWRRNQPLASTITYETYQYDIPATYPSNVYEKGPDGEFIIIEVDGKRQLKIEHAKGDVQLDPETGEPIIQFHAGAAKRDEYGDLIPTSGREVVLWWDLVLFDAQYLYATRPLDVTYTNSVANVLNEWINDTLTPLREMALERTELSFQPVNSLRYVNAIVDDGSVISIYAPQTLVVDVYVEDGVYANMTIRTAMEATIQSAVERALDAAQVSRKLLVDTISDGLDDDSVTVAVHGLGGSGDYDVVTLLDVTTRLSVAKVLALDSSGELYVMDNLTVNFKLHSQIK